MPSTLSGGTMEHLNGVNYLRLPTAKSSVTKMSAMMNSGLPGHIPGRPLLPGVLMIEAAAQLASFYVKGVSKYDGFIGFGGVEDCKFRQQVMPGCRLYMIAQQEHARHRRFKSRMQGLGEWPILYLKRLLSGQ